MSEPKGKTTPKPASREQRQRAHETLVAGTEELEESAYQLHVEELKNFEKEALRQIGELEKEFEEMCPDEFQEYQTWLKTEFEKETVPADETEA